MVLVDTPVWIEHFRGGVAELVALLDAGRVLAHPAVVGELSCGTLRRRATTLALMQQLPRAVVASDDEALLLLERHRLFGSGLGWTDVHLLAAAALSHCRLWTTDGRLAAAGKRLRVGFVG